MQDVLQKLEDIQYQIEKIDGLVHIIRDNYYNKNSVDYTNSSECYDLCVCYKDVSILLDTIQDISQNSKNEFISLFNNLFTKKEIQ